MCCPGGIVGKCGRCVVFKYDALVEKHCHFSGGHYTCIAVGGGDAYEFGTLEVIGKDVDIFQIVVARFCSRLYEHAYDEAVAVVGVK